MTRPHIHKQLLLLALCLLAFGRETPDEFLHRNGIELTRDGLIAALYNPDWMIRLSAGERLVTNREATAIPELVAAAERESIPVARLQLYSMIGRLGEKQGLSALLTACSDPDLDVPLRLTAAQFVARLDPNACLPEVASLLESNIARENAQHAITIFSNLKFATSPINPKTKQRILAVLLLRLGDPEAFLRGSASSALVAIGGEAEISAVRSAAARESDEGIRQSMQRDLEAVERKTP